jgi:hypothetical protein
MRWARIRSCAEVRAFSRRRIVRQTVVPPIAEASPRSSVYTKVASAAHLSHIIRKGPPTAHPPAPSYPEPRRRPYPMRVFSAAYPIT